MVVSHLALKRELVSRQALEECLLEQQRPPHAPLGQILVRRRLLSAGDLLQLMRAAGNVQISCSGCQKSSPYNRLDPTRPPQCQACGGRLAAGFAGSARAQRGLDATQQDPPSQRVRPNDTRRDSGSRDRSRRDSGSAALRGSRILSGDGVSDGTFGAYEIVEELGRGGMGVVYKVRQPNLDRHVALKVLLGGDLASRTQVARFQREAEIAARLKHPNIVQVHDVGVLGEHYYFTMDLIEGLPLSRLVKKRQVGIRRAVEIARDVAKGLAHAHKREVIHRDIKPDNIIIDREGNAVITDFGLAREIDPGEGARLTREGALVGTPFYMSPEQASGKSGEVGAQSDIYALGVVLFEMLTFRLPFLGDTQIELTSRIINDEPPSLTAIEPSIDRDLETIALKALAKSTRDRYATSDELADDLERFLRGESVRARRQNPLQRLWRRARRNRRTLIASVVGGVAVAATVLAVFAFVQKLGEPPPVAKPVSPQPPPIVAEPVASEQQLADEAVTEAKEALRRARRTPSGEDYRSALEAAVRSLTQALGHRLNQDDTQLLILRGRAQESLRRADLAQNDYQHALGLADPAAGLPEAAFLLARLHLREDRKAQAMQVLETQAKLSAQDEWRDLVLAVLSNERDDDPAAALQAVGRARELNPLLPEAYVLEGVLHIRLGSAAEAMRALEKAVDLDSKSATAWAILARLRLSLKPANGRQDLERALELDPDNDLALRLRASELQEKGRLDEAISDLRRVLSQRPNDGDLLYMLAQYYTLNKQSTLAAQMLSRLEQRQPLDPRPYELRAFAHLFARDFPRCLAELRRGLRAVQGSEEGRERLTKLFKRLALDTRQLESGEEWIRDELAQRPEDPDVLTFRVRLLASVDRDEQALELLDLVRAKFPRHAEAWQTQLHLGLTTFKWTPEQLREGLRSYEQTFADDGEALVWLAKLHAIIPDLQDMAKAEDLAQRTLRLLPKNVFARVVLALVAMSRKQIQDARGLLIEALSIDPEDLDALAIMGVVEFNLRNLEGAERVLNSVLARDPFRANALEGLALVMMRTNRPREAVAVCKQFLALCKEAERSPDPRILAQLADVMIPLGQPDELFSLLKENAEREEHPDFKVVLGQAYAKAGRFVDARKVLTETLEKHPGHPPAVELLKLLDARGK